MSVEGEGDIRGFIWTGEGFMEMTLCNVLYVPAATASILAVQRLTAQGVDVYFGSHHQRLYKNGTIIPVDRSSHREYSLNFFRH